MNRYNFIFDIIDQSHPSVIIDIGVWNGKRSSEIISRSLKYKNVIYYGFDLWEDQTSDEWMSEFTSPKKQSSYQEALDNIKSIQGNFLYHLIKGNTRETLKDFYISNLDFVFIDGGHSLDTIKSDWLNIKKIMNKNTIVIFDDYWHNRNDAGCKSLVDSLSSDNQYRIDILGLDKMKLYDISLAKVTLL